ncbi:hypothetical protein ACHAXT_003549 [Thalassiosira profunda]
MMATNSPDLEGPSASEATPLAPSSPSGVAVGPPAPRPTRWPAARVFLAVASTVLVMMVVLARGHHAMTARVPLERHDFDASQEEHEKISLTLPASPLRSSVEGLLGRHRQKGEGAALRWGILGPGRIAHDFAATLSVMGCTITAVAASHDDEASSALARARKFAKLFSIPKYYGSYEELAADPDVDIVYVATTNQNHMQPTSSMLRAGKNVLVEKPTTLTYEEAKMMYDEAKKRGLFLMTNHWTRFFPLVKYLRRIFLDSDDANALDEEESATLDPAVEMRHDLGKALAMRGDFSFITPLNPSDRYLNRTLGGGVTLDVGCYLVELALLAAYDHRQSHQSTMGEMSSEALKEYLMPDGVEATGHGVYEGRSFPVDVESSFSLRWGGGAEGIAVDGDGSTYSATDPSADEFTMIGSFQASFRRPSSFDVEYVFERGRIVVHGPGNCPSEMTVYEHENRYGPLVRETKVQFPLPPIRKALLRYGRPNYPRPEGFAYVIEAIEKCMTEMGVPGRAEGLERGEGCLELEENTIEEQLVTVEVTEKVLKKMNYFGKGHHSRC